MTKYRYVGSHAQEIAIDDRVVMAEPGAFVDMSDDDVNNVDNKILIEDNLLVMVEGENAVSTEETPQPETPAETETETETETEQGDEGKTEEDTETETETTE